jgi:hypothetical protein
VKNRGEREKKKTISKLFLTSSIVDTINVIKI